MVATFAEQLLARADDTHPGLLFEDERYSWAEVVAAARVRAGVLDRLGSALTPSGRRLHVGVLLENVPEFVFWIGAAALARATLVGINPTRRGEELAGDIRHTDCDVIVTDSTLAALLDGLDTGVPAERLLLVDSPSHESEPPPSSRELPEAQPADRLLLLFTSGSTGAPKAVVCSQGRLAAIGVHGARFGIGRDTVTYLAMPLFHGNSIMANLAMAVAGGATIALRRKFSSSGFIADIRRYGVTYFNYVGRALAYVLATPGRPDDPDTTLTTVFGTEASSRDMRRFGERFGCAVIEGYGSSEGAISISRTPDTPPDALGVPGPDIQVAVLDPETGAECARAKFGPDGALLNPDEAIGELTGLNVAHAFEGYYRNPEADAERLRNGRYWSGDLGYRDEAGFFYFAGRGTDRLRVDSENFAAAPIERILGRWQPVVMCAVYPVPDPRTGDQVMAALEMAQEFDPAAFAAFLGRQQDLGTKWAPRIVRIVRSMPLTSTNKVDKRPLRRTRWDTPDPVWWRPGRDLRYVPMDAERVTALRAEFEKYGRGHLLITP